MAGGLAALRVLDYHVPKSELVVHKELLDKAFSAHPPQSVGQASQKIAALTGIHAA